MTDFKPMVDRIAFVGNYYPRQCGIATFTTDLSDAIENNNPGTSCFVVAMNDQEGGYAYPARVGFEVNDQDVFAYRVAAEFVNLNDVDIVSLQHEYGIYGGQTGSYILHMLRELRMPAVTTLHTILKDPNPSQMHILKEIGGLSSRVVVMSELGAEILKDVYKIPAAKIDFIHHGIPDTPFVDPNFYKDHFGVEGRTVLLTFGLLSRNKGIENVIKAIPAIIQEHPDLVYMILGSTHPNVIQKEGEAYRQSLQDLVEKLGVAENVIFDNRFVSPEELFEFVGATDIYVTPYLNPQQITSGTLAYTAGAGKAVISTPYWYAQELLSDGRGMIVPFADPEAITEKVNYLLEHEAERHAMRKRAYTYGREMIWPRVSERYMEVFERARNEPVKRIFQSSSWSESGSGSFEMPILDMSHLQTMTDDCGLFQHAKLTLPNYTEGYTTDDNARGLIASVMAEESDLEDKSILHELEKRYLSFLWYAYNEAKNGFRNFLGYDRRWMEEKGSEDSNGRALWSLGYATSRIQFDNLRESAAMLFNRALPEAYKFSNPRSWAFTLLGLNEYLAHFPGDRTAQTLRNDLSERLMTRYRQTSQPDWLWFEETLTYSNARLSQALIISGEGQNNGDMISAGLETLDWLCRIQTSESGFFSPIGSNGWYSRLGLRARYDQQPVEASAMISACAAAYHATGNPAWLDHARRAFQWFLGANDLGIPLYDPATGGCQDGLQPDRVNKNQGAESTLAFLMGLMEMQTMAHRQESSGLDDHTSITLPVHHTVTEH